jgi:hypothetical protein
MKRHEVEKLHERRRAEMTPEDLAIDDAASTTVWLAGADGDSIDYRAMMAREVFKEREWRIGGVSVTPAECALRDLDPANLRVTVELINGETL